MNQKMLRGSLICLFERMSVSMAVICHQRAESSRTGSIGGSRRSTFTNVSLAHSFSVWVRSPLHVLPTSGNSLTLRIRITDTPCHLGEIVEEGREGGVFLQRPTVQMLFLFNQQKAVEKENFKAKRKTNHNH